MEGLSSLTTISYAPWNIRRRTVIRSARPGPRRHNRPGPLDRPTSRHRIAGSTVALRGSAPRGHRVSVSVSVSGGLHRPDGVGKASPHVAGRISRTHSCLLWP